MLVILIEVALEVILRATRTGYFCMPSAFKGAPPDVSQCTGWMGYIESISNIAGNTFTMITSFIVIFLTVIIASANSDTNKREKRARIERVKAERSEKLLSLSNYLIQNRGLFESIEYPISDKEVLYRCVVYFDFDPSHKSRPNEFLQYSFAKVENIANPNSRLSFRFMGHFQVEPASIEIIEQPEFDLESYTWENLLHALTSALNYKIRDKLSFEPEEIRGRRVEEISLETRFTGKRRGHTGMNTKADQKIVDAILNINADKVKSQIKKASHIDARDSSGRTFLHYAVSIAYIQLQNYYERALVKDPQAANNSRYLSKLMSDLEKIIKILIKKGANINARDNRGEPVMYAAADAGNLKAVNILIKKKARVDMTSKRSGSTALHIAVYSGSREIVEALITNKYDPNCKNSAHETPLHFAAKLDKLNMLDQGNQPALVEILVNNQSEIAEALIKNGAKVNEANQEGMTPLHYAVQLNQSSMAEMLITSQFEISDKLVESQLEIARKLIEKGADLNKTDGHGRTPLHYAVCLDPSSILKVLIENTSSTEEKMEKFEIVKRLAESQLTLAEILIDNNAKIDEKDEEGKTPFHYAFQFDQSSIIKLLIENDPSAVDKLDLLGFLEVLTESQRRVAKRLLVNGAKIDEKDKKKRTPLHYASQLDQPIITKMLTDYQSDTEDKLSPSNVIEMLARSQLTVISFLIEEGAKINEKDECGETPLHKVSYIGYLPAIRALIDSSAEVNDMNSSGNTPLQITLCNIEPHKALPIADLYIEKKASISFRDRLSLFVPRSVRALRSLFYN